MKDTRDETTALPILYSLWRGMCGLLCVMAVLFPCPANAADLLVSGYLSNTVHVYNASTGAYKYFIGNTATDPLLHPVALSIGPDGLLYVGSPGTSKILSYNLKTRGVINALPFNFGIFSMGFDLHGNLLVGTGGQVKLYDSSTNTFKNYLTGSFPSNVQCTLFDSNNFLFTADSINVREYDGQGASYNSGFIKRGTGGIYAPFGMDYGPDGNLYVSDNVNNLILKFDVKGNYLSSFARGKPLTNPGRMKFGPDGNLYVIDKQKTTNGQVLEFQGPYGPDPGMFVRVVVPAGTGGLSGPTDLVFVPSAISDYNADGKNDILWLNDVSGDVLAWNMNGTKIGSYDFLAHGVSTAWKIVGTGDLNRDGVPDIIWQNQTSGDVLYWLLNSRHQVTAIGYIAHGVDLDWKIAAVGDINRDGSPDLIWQNQKSGAVLYWLLSGAAWSGTYGFISSGLPTAWKMSALADLNGDGSLDLIWQNQNTGDITYSLMRGVTQTGITGYLAHSVPLEWRVAAMTDLDGDGSADLIWQNKRTGDVLYWLMNGLHYSGVEDYIARGNPLSWKIVGPH